MAGSGQRRSAGGPAESDTSRATRRAKLRRARRRRRIAVAGVGAAAALVAVVSLATSGSEDIPARVRIGGVDVGGLSTEDAREKLAPAIRRTRQRTVTFSSSDDPGFTMRVSGTILTTGARLDEALESARTSRSRLGGIFAKLGIGDEKAVPLRYEVNDDAVAAIVRKAQDRVGREATSATVRVADDQIVTTPAKEGREVDRARLTQQLATLPASIDVPIRVARPRADDGDAEQAKQLAERVRSIGRDVTLEGRTAVLAPAAATRALRFAEDGDAIRVSLDADVLRSVLVKPLGANERAPRDARFEIRGERVAVIPSAAGRRLDADAISSAIVRDPARTTVAAAIRTTAADFTTAEAKALGIKERVSSFTTNYDCCQDRVTNIQRAAAILDGTIIKAGARFSLNDALGERTAERGFVKAPAIAAGELVPSYGGGVSQVATTTYNAAFFAGLELIAHTPHEFYISRYPMGREATVSWRTPDLVFRNDWDAAILMSVRAASNGITVSFYSSMLGRRVESSTGQPTNRTEPKIIERQNPELPPGSRKVVQTAGSGGFAISYTRKVYRGTEVRRDETFRWNYRPENAIVELGPPLPEPTTPTGTSTGGGTSTTGTSGTSTKPSTAPTPTRGSTTAP